MSKNNKVKKFKDWENDDSANFFNKKGLTKKPKFKENDQSKNFSKYKRNHTDWDDIE
jgi:hypothetical protein